MRLRAYTPSEDMLGAPLEQTPALLSNIRPHKNLPDTNTLAYFVPPPVRKKKRFFKIETWLKFWPKNSHFLGKKRAQYLKTFFKSLFRL
jgi:hypothetical protein